MCIRDSNGAAARCVQTGDKIIIMCYAQMTPEEVKKNPPKVVSVSYTHLDVYKRQYQFIVILMFECPMIYCKSFGFMFLLASLVQNVCCLLYTSTSAGSSNTVTKVSGFSIPVSLESTGLIQWFFTEIGRASCRERVCLYV